MQLQANPLEHVLVLELASVLAGPSVGQFFAELGAEVIKIENVKTGGDVTRSWLGEGEHTRFNGISAYFSSVNWGKMSLALDLSKQEGTKILHDLAARADIVISSFKSGDDVKLQADYELLKEINPSIIYGHITGYGPGSNRAGYDAIVQAEAGFMHMNGEPGGESLKMPVALIDVLAAHHLKEGILLSLLNREKTGKGDYVQVSLLDAALASLANQATNWLVAGKIPDKMGQEHPNIAPYGKSFLTADDRNILLAVGTDKQFQRLCDVLSLAALKSDQRFTSNKMRVANREILNQEIAKKINRWPASDLLAVLHQSSIPCGEIRRMDVVFEQELSQNMLIQNGELAGVRNVAFQFENGDSKSSLASPPGYGEHSRHILKSLLNYATEHIDDLMRRDIIT